MHYVVFYAVYILIITEERKKAEVAKIQQEKAEREFVEAKQMVDGKQN